MQTATLESLRHQLVNRRTRLEETIAQVGPEEDLVQLLQQVDSALGRMSVDDYGLCAVCHGAVDDKDLAVNPLAQYCLCDLSAEQRKALEHDLGLAWRIQSALLPDPDLHGDEWNVHYRYEPAGPVSGDYCDLWESPVDGVYFFVGDVSGKGVSASLLMAHLNATLRSQLEFPPALVNLVERANQVLLASTIDTHYATLVSGRAGSGGAVELVNAGHCPPLLVRPTGVEPVDSTGFPIGLVGDRPYETRSLKLRPGETLFLYTDGLTEARRADGTEYGTERLSRLLYENREMAPRALADRCREDLKSFLAGASRADDLTLMALRRRDV